MRLKIVRSSCIGGKCPTLYASEDGRYFIQGYKTPHDISSDVSLAENETIVEIDKELVELIKGS